MLAALRRRGPDAEHVVGWNVQGQRIEQAAEVDTEVALIHTRLAIMDPRPEADQPFSNDDGSVWLCYNGEVYDWQHHADELKAQGVQFKTHADTEFILRGYEAWSGRSSAQTARHVCLCHLGLEQTRSFFSARPHGP